MTRDGRLWFPTTKGVAVIDRDYENSSPLPALDLEFSEVSVDGRRLDARQPARIYPGFRQIQFHYAAIHLSNPEHVRYEYKLEPGDTDWVPAANRRVVNYMNLAHGRYRFSVRASVPNHHHHASEASFDMQVLPYFYEDPVYLSLFTVALFGAAYGFYQLRLRQVRLRWSLVLEERARMAREIHDTLSQGLVGISSQLNAVAGRIRAHDQGAEQQLELARKMVRHSLTEARRSMMDLRDSLLDADDLPTALARAVNLWSSDIPVRLDLQVSGYTPPFPRDTEQNLLRITQEAVHNAVKHSGASRLWIRLHLQEERLILAIEDDGHGFDPSGSFLMLHGHFGLLGMRERAERIGAEFVVSSEPGEGTRVTVSIPVPKPPPDNHKPRWLAPFRLPVRRAQS
jgi:signal transduction histidine kinase